MIKFGVIGDPIEQSRSPQLHSLFYKNMNISASTEKIHCTSDKLTETMNTFRNGKWKGLNVTIPHKEAVMEYLDSIDHEASTIGAVNCIVNRNGTLHGTNTDEFGFKQMLRINNVETNGKSCLVVGAGGAGKTAVNVLSDLGVNSIHVWNRNQEKADSLITKLNTKTSVFHCSNESFSERVSTVDIIINCTPLGMSYMEGESPVSREHIKSEHVLIDCIYNPVETQFLRDGKEVGAKIISGIDMFIYQGYQTMKTWFPDLDWNGLPLSDLKTKLMDATES